MNPLNASNSLLIPPLRCRSSTTHPSLGPPVVIVARQGDTETLLQESCQENKKWNVSSTDGRQEVLDAEDADGAVEKQVISSSIRAHQCNPWFKSSEQKKSGSVEFLVPVGDAAQDGSRLAGQEQREQGEHRKAPGPKSEEELCVAAKIGTPVGQQRMEVFLNFSPEGFIGSVTEALAGKPP